MRRAATVCLLVWMGVLIAACGQEGSYTLRISFPDEASRQDTASLYLWALRSDAGTCPGLVDTGVDPADTTVYASLVLENPPQGPEVLPGVPNGMVLFLVEGRTSSDAKILRGCAREEMKDGATLDVRIELERICTPGEEGEIPGNDLDDDCDGLTDECTRDIDCRDAETCTLDLCVEESCHHLPSGEDAACNDGDPCTLGDSCGMNPQEEWVCAGTPRDCSAYASGCARGVCNPANGECRTEPLDEGEACDDGQYCTRGETCQAGTCTGGATRDCDDGNACTRDECNEGLNLCDHPLEPRPGEEGPIGDATCSDGEDNDCDGATDDGDSNCRGCATDADCDDGNPCTRDSCAAPDCLNEPVANGTQCEDGLFCTELDWCENGVCLSRPVDCTPPEGRQPCYEDVCIEEIPECERRPLPEGTECDPLDWCFVGGTCNLIGPDMVCSSISRDCDDDNPCTIDFCDSQLQQCMHNDAGPGTPEGPVNDPTCFNGLDDDCDGWTDVEDNDCGCEQAWECGTECAACPEGAICYRPAHRCVQAFWVFVNPDTFLMGSDETEPGRSQNETPHTVTLTRPFVILTVEVTRDFFSMVMGFDPSMHTGNGPDGPVENVSWHEAASFCNMLSYAEGYPACYDCYQAIGVTCTLSQDFSTPYDCPGYRLPTEAEWEYAARSGTQTATYNGTVDFLLDCEPDNTVLDPIAWYCANSDYLPQPVGRMDASPWLLRDMLGNVAEWCHDFFGDYPPGSDTDPVGPPTSDGAGWVVRGGSFYDYASSCRAAYRNASSWANQYVGFRPVRTSSYDWPP